MVLAGDKKVQDRARELANERMRKEILPLLSLQHPRASGWNPLRISLDSEYGMKLALPDALVVEILHSDALLDQVAQIVTESTAAAAVDEGASFVTSLLSDLMSDG